MTTFQKFIIGLGLLAVATSVWLGRYTLVPGQRGDGMPPAYVLDRWTGKVFVIIGAQIRPVVALEQ